MVVGYLPYYIAYSILTVIIVAPLTLLIFFIRWRMITRKLKKEELDNDTGPIEGTVEEIRNGEHGTTPESSEESDDGRVEQ